MKKEVKGFVAGVIIASAMFMTPFSIAEEISKTINVVFNSVNLTVNGENVKAENILYNGTTYVPLRKIAEILDKKVGWDENTNTASINDKDYITTKGELIEKMTRLQNFAYEINNEYYGENTHNIMLQVDNLGRLYTDTHSVSDIPILLSIAFGAYKVQPSENPNLDNEIIELDRGQYMEYIVSEVYEGARTYNIIDLTLYDKEKTKSLKIKYGSNQIPEIKKIDNESFDAVINFENINYINIDKILNYLGVEYKVYTNTNKGFNVIEII